MGATDAERLEAARTFAQWHLGSSAWADETMGAYNNPEAAMKRLAEAGCQRAKKAAEQ